MTSSEFEFKAWFEGFVEGISGTPTPEQFARIKARVNEMGNGPALAANNAAFNRGSVLGGVATFGEFGNNRQTDPNQYTRLVSSKLIKDN